MNIISAEFFFSHEGRITRLAYWLWVLLGIAAFALFGFLAGLAKSGGGVHALVVAAAAFAGGYSAVVVQVKRWHDRDKSGWWVLVNLVPVIGPLWGLVECGFLRGTPGRNRFGADPVDEDADPIAHTA